MASPAPMVPPAAAAPAAQPAAGGPAAVAAPSTTAPGHPWVLPGTQAHPAHGPAEPLTAPSPSAELGAASAARELDTAQSASAWASTVQNLAAQNGVLQAQLVRLLTQLQTTSTNQNDHIADARAHADRMNSDYRADLASAAARNEAAEADRSNQDARRIALASEELELARERLRQEADGRAQQLEATQLAATRAQEQFDAKLAQRRRMADATAADRRIADAARKQEADDRARSANYVQATKALQHLSKASSPTDWVAQVALIRNALLDPLNLQLADNWTLVQHCLSNTLLLAWHDFLKTNEHRFAALRDGSATPTGSSGTAKFDWLLEFETAMYSDAQHIADLQTWQSLRQGADSVRDFAAKFNKLTNSWGRFSVDTTEAARVRQLRWALNDRTALFLAMPDSPCVKLANNEISPAACTTAAVFDYLLTKEAFTPNPGASAFGGVAPGGAGHASASGGPNANKLAKTRERADWFNNHASGAARTPPTSWRGRDADARSADRFRGGPQPVRRRSGSRPSSPAGRPRHPRCVRCHDFGHYAGACEAAMTPAQVQANVKKVEASRAARTCWSCGEAGHFANACSDAPLPAEILAIWSAVEIAVDSTFAAVTSDPDHDVPHRDEDDEYAFLPDDHAVVAICVLAPPAGSVVPAPVDLPSPQLVLSDSPPPSSPSSTPSSPSTDSSAMGAVMHDLRDDINLHADGWSTRDYTRLSAFYRREIAALDLALRLPPSPRRLAPSPHYVLPHRVAAAPRIVPGVHIDRARDPGGPGTPVSTGSSTLSNDYTNPDMDLYWTRQLQQAPLDSTSTASSPTAAAPSFPSSPPVLAAAAATDTALALAALTAVDTDIVARWRVDVSGLWHNDAGNLHVNFGAAHAAYLGDDSARNSSSPTSSPPSSIAADCSDDAADDLVDADVLAFSNCVADAHTVGTFVHRRGNGLHPGTAFVHPDGLSCWISGGSYRRAGKRRALNLDIRHVPIATVLPQRRCPSESTLALAAVLGDDLGRDDTFHNATRRQRVAYSSHPQTIGDSAAPRFFNETRREAWHRLFDRAARGQCDERSVAYNHRRARCATKRAVITRRAFVLPSDSQQSFAAGAPAMTVLPAVEALLRQCIANLRQATPPADGAAASVAPAHALASRRPSPPAALAVTRRNRLRRLRRRREMNRLLMAAASSPPADSCPHDPSVSRLTRARRRRLLLARSSPAAPTHAALPPTSVAGVPLLMVVKAPRKLSSSRTSSASPGVVAALRTQQERRAAASSPTIAAPPPGSPVLAPASPVDAPQPVPSPAAVARFCHEQARRSIVPIPCEAAVFSAAVDVDCLHRDLGRFGPCDPSMTDNYSTTLNVVRARDPDNFALFLASFRASGVYTWSEFLRAWRRYIMCFPEGPAVKFVRGDDPCVQRTLVMLALRMHPRARDRDALLVDTPSAPSPPAVDAPAVAPATATAPEIAEQCVHSLRDVPCERNHRPRCAAVLREHQVAQPEVYSDFEENFRGAASSCWINFLAAWKRAFACFPAGDSVKFHGASNPCQRRCFVSLALHGLAQQPRLPGYNPYLVQRPSAAPSPPSPCRSPSPKRARHDRSLPSSPLPSALAASRSAGPSSSPALSLPEGGVAGAPTAASLPIQALPHGAALAVNDSFLLQLSQFCASAAASALAAADSRRPADRPRPNSAALLRLESALQAASTLLTELTVPAVAAGPDDPTAPCLCRPPGSSQPCGRPSAWNVDVRGRFAGWSFDMEPRCRECLSNRRGEPCFVCAPPPTTPPAACLPVSFAHASPAAPAHAVAAAPVGNDKRQSKPHFVKTFTIDGIPMDVHIDTCSPYCLVNTGSLTADQRAKLQPYTGPRLIGGNAGGMSVRGQYFGVAEIQGCRFRIPWLAVDDLPMRRILGMDFAERHLDNLSPRNNTMLVLTSAPANMSSMALPAKRAPAAAAAPCAPRSSTSWLAERAVCDADVAAPSAPAAAPAPWSAAPLLAQVRSIPGASDDACTAIEALTSELVRLTSSATRTACTPVSIECMPAAASAELSAANVAAFVASGGAPPLLSLPGAAACDSVPHAACLASTASSLPSLCGASSTAADSDSTSALGDAADDADLAILLSDLHLPPASCTEVRVRLPTPPAGCKQVALAMDPARSLHLPPAALPSPSLSLVHRADDAIDFAFVCVNNVTAEPLRLKAGTGLCDVTFVPDELRPSPPDTNIVLRLPWLEFLRDKFSLSESEMNDFKELYQSRAVATSDFADDDWWINPMWCDLEHALALVHRGRPRRFIMLGPARRSTLDSPSSWTATPRAWGCHEVVLPRSVGLGFFQTCSPDGTLHDLPLPPSGWDVVAYFGHRDQIGDLAPGIAVAAAASADDASASDSARAYHSVHIDEENLSPSEVAQARAFIQRWAHLFDVDDYPRVKDFEVRVDLTGVQPFYCPPRRLSPQRLQAQRDSVANMLKLGVIEPGCGPWASPMTQVPKMSMGKQTGIRDCHDLRVINSRIPRDVYPLPNIADIFDALQGAAFMCASDLYKGFWQLRVHPDSRDLFGFATQQGLFRFVVLPFGYANAPAIFQRLMDTTLAGLLWLSVVVYLDDCVWWGTDFASALARGDAVLQRFDDRNIRLQAAKCHWFFRELRLLGHIVNGRGTRPDPIKLSALRDLAAPTDVPTLSHFIGLAGYYMRYVPDFAFLCAPLFALRKKGVAWDWTPDHAAAFASIIDALNKPGLLLTHPVPDAPLRIETDASMLSIAGCIMQLLPGDDDWRPIAFASRCLTSAERNYSVTELECLAVVYCFNKFRCYVLGRPFELVVDHSALVWLLKRKEPPTGKLPRWVLLLQEYQYTVVHRPGKLHILADALSRLPRVREDPAWSEPAAPGELAAAPAAALFDCPRTGARGWASAWTLLAAGASSPAASSACLTAAAFHRALPALAALPDVRASARLQAATHASLPAPHPHAVMRLPSAFELCGAQRACQEFRAFFDYLAHGAASAAATAACPGFDRYCAQLSLDDDGLLVRRAPDDAPVSHSRASLPVVPPALRPTFLELAHGAGAAGHLGSTKTFLLLVQWAWWPFCRASVDSYVAACVCVRRRQKEAARTHSPLQQYQAFGNNDVVAADVAGPWPTTDGFSFVLVMTCLFSRFTLLMPLVSTTALETAQVLLRNWILVFGPMRRLLTDRGTNFTSEIITELGKFLGFDKVVTTAYNPAGDPAERRFRHLSNSIAAAAGVGEPWPNVLASCAYAYNISYNRMTGSVPLFTWLGRAPRALFAPPRDAGTGTVHTATARAAARSLYETLMYEANAVFRATAAANGPVRANFDRAVDANFVPPAVGDLVWLFTPRLFRTSEDFAEFHTSKSQNRYGDHPRLVTVVHPVAAGPAEADGTPPSVRSADPRRALVTHVTLADRFGNLTEKVHVNRVLPYVAPFPGNGADRTRMAVGIDAHRDSRSGREYRVTWYQPSGDIISAPQWLPMDKVSARHVAAYLDEHPDVLPFCAGSHVRA